MIRRDKVNKNGKFSLQIFCLLQRVPSIRYTTLLNKFYLFTCTLLNVDNHGNII